MAKNYTDHFKEETSSTSGSEPVYLMEITHADLAVPVRVVNDTDNLVLSSYIVGEIDYWDADYTETVEFIACAFRVQFPDDVAQAMPRVPISIDNIGRELTQWLEASNGGKGASVRIMQIMRDDPSTIEQEYTLTLISAHQTWLEITGDLGYEDVLNSPGLAATQTPETQPNIF